MMPTALLDTNAVSDIMRDDANVKARIAAFTGPIVTSVMVSGEIRYGLDRLPGGKKRSDLEKRASTILAALQIEPITEQVAQAYGTLKASLEAQGLNLFDNDLWIAATALTVGAVFVTRDQVFKKVPSLSVEDWSA